MHVCTYSVSEVKDDFGFLLLQVQSSPTTGLGLAPVLQLILQVILPLLILCYPFN